MDFHFLVLEQEFSLAVPGVIFFSCLKIKPKNNQTAYGFQEQVVKIHENRVTVVFGQHEIYKFQAVHPMFFQKLRGHMYDMHNRSRFACDEYLR